MPTNQPAIYKTTYLLNITDTYQPNDLPTVNQQTYIIVFLLRHSEPSLEPQNVLVKAQSSTSITVTWDHIPENRIHGVLQGYTIFYRATDESSFSEMNVGATDIYAQIPNLRKYTFYLVSICGRTSKGCGVKRQTIMVRTLDDGKPCLKIHSNRS